MYARDIAFTPTVKSIQEKNGFRGAYAKVESRDWRKKFTPDLTEFLAGLDMFYPKRPTPRDSPTSNTEAARLASSRCLTRRRSPSPTSVATGSTSPSASCRRTPKRSSQLMDYANQQRVKLWGTAREVENDDELLERLAAPEYPGKVERAIVFSIEAWDINCPQNIHPRYAERQVRPVIEKLQARLAELEQELAKRDALF